MVSVPRSSEETKGRLLDAAASEFAEFGLAGARTSRIADTAGIAEALLFRYFGNKRALFELVFDSFVVRTLDDVPITPADLPGYAGRLFDYYRQHRTVVRLAMWASLESDAQPLPRVVSAFREKEEQIRRAQEAGKVSEAMPAAELLALVVHLSLSGSEVSAGTEPPADRRTRRASVVAAVRAMVGA